MEKNYYHVSFNSSDNVSFETPSAEGRNIILISGTDVVKMEYADGNELFQISHDGKVDVFATFPIELDFR